MCPRYINLTKSINRLIKYFTACKSHLYQKISLEIEQEYHKKKNVSSGNWKDKIDLKDKTDYSANTNSFFKMLTKDTL